MPILTQAKICKDLDQTTKKNENACATLMYTRLFKLKTTTFLFCKRRFLFCKKF